MDRSTPERLGDESRKESRSSDDAPDALPAPRVALVCLLVVLVTGALTLPWLGERSLWFPDEPDIAEPTMVMLETGDWTVPMRGGEPWADYPPLVYWAGAASATLFGTSPGTLRLPVTLGAILLVVLTAGVTARVTRSASAGTIAGLCLATVPHFAFQSIMFHPDMFFALLQCVGIGAYVYGTTRERPGASWFWCVLGFAALGGAVLAKGPLGLLLPGFVLTLWHASLREWRKLFALAPLALVALAVAFPWYLAFARAIGGDEVWRELYLQNFARFTAGDRGHEQPWYYYLTDIWGQWAPWSLLLPTALLFGWRDRADRFVRLAWIWIVASFVFLSIASTKRTVYLLPAYPAAAFLVARHLVAIPIPDHVRVFQRRFVTAVGGFLAVSGVVLAFGVLFADRLRLPRHIEEDPFASAIVLPVVALGIALVVGGGLAARANRAASLARGPIALGLALAFSFTVAHALVLPEVDAVRTYAPATRWLRDHCGEEPIGIYLPGSVLKRSGFRVSDPLFLPLEQIPDSTRAAAWLADPAHVLVLADWQLDEVLEAQPQLEALACARVQCSSRTFLVLIGEAALARPAVEPERGYEPVVLRDRVD